MLPAANNFMPATTAALASTSSIPNSEEESMTETRLFSDGTRQETLYSKDGTIKTEITNADNTFESIETKKNGEVTVSTRDIAGIEMSTRFNTDGTYNTAIAEPVFEDGQTYEKKTEILTDSVGASAKVETMPDGN